MNSTQDPFRARVFKDISMPNAEARPCEERGRNCYGFENRGVDCCPRDPIPGETAGVTEQSACHPVRTLAHAPAADWERSSAEVLRASAVQYHRRRAFDPALQRKWRVPPRPRVPCGRCDEYSPRDSSGGRNSIPIRSPSRRCRAQRCRWQRGSDTCRSEIHRALPDAD